MAQTQNEHKKNTAKSADDGFEDLRQAILLAALVRAPFDGWTGTMVRGAGEDVGVDRAELRAALPGGVRDLLRLWSENVDEEMAAGIDSPEFKSLRIREKVAFGVRARIAAMAEHKEAARRAAAYLALPLNAKFASAHAWSAADAVWRAIGDTSTDYNYYTKRAILSAVITTTLARWFADDSEDGAATEAFLDARIDNVMQFEKVKSRVQKIVPDPFAPIEFLARLRYPLNR